MKIAQPKPCLGSKFVREAFFRHFAERKVDDRLKSRINRIFRLMMVFKEFAAIIRACLYGTKLCLSYGMLQDNWNGPFSKLFSDFLDKQETMLFLALVKPKLRELVLDLSFRESIKNDRLTNYFVGIPHLVIKETDRYESGYPLLKKLASHVSKFECPLEYLLKYKLPPMKLETCLVKISDQPKINLGRLCSKIQIRQICLDFRRRRSRQYQIVCSDQYPNPSVEELTLKNDDYYPRIHLPDNLLEQFPNLKRVFRSLNVPYWSRGFYEKLSASVECAREWVQKSPDLRFVFDAYMNDYSISNRAALLGQLRGLRLLGDEEPSLVSKKELENDPDIKLCRHYESKSNLRILVCSTGQFKFFFWYN